jgi:hypothetical protein
MWTRETLEDLTAAEFACRVEAVADDEGRKRKRKRAVDYEKLLSKLNRRIRDLGCEGNLREGSDITCVLQSGVGKGTLVYTDEQRTALLKRLIATRETLLDVIRGNELEVVNDLPFQIQLPEIRVEIPKVEEDLTSTSPGPKLYMRDDGTVDWDGALQDQAALREFGSSVWARINGRGPEALHEEAAIGESPGEGHHLPSKVTAKIEDTPEIQEARAKLEEVTRELVELEKSHTRLLNSVLSAGQATANVRLATLEAEQRNKIRESVEAIEQMKGEVSFQTLIYELERIYTYLLGELGNPAMKGYYPLQDRMNVAEFGLLESQIDSFKRQLEVEGDLDDDVLAVVFDQLTDFKRRLGIDYYVTGFSFDAEAIRRWLGDIWTQTRKGLAFYVKGVQLFWNDIIFSLRLINRAAQGYTLKPREVRNIRYVGSNSLFWFLIRGALTIALFSNPQTNLQRYHYVHSFCDHPADPPVTDRSRSCLRCHSAFLP